MLLETGYINEILRGRKLKMKVARRKFQPLPHDWGAFNLLCKQMNYKADVGNETKHKSYTVSINSKPSF